MIRYRSMVALKYLICVLLCIAVPAGELYPQSKNRKSSAVNVAKRSSTSSRSSNLKSASKGKSNSNNAKVNPKIETSAEAKKRQAENQKEIARTKDQIKRNEAEVKKNLKELGMIQMDIMEGEKVVKSTTNELTTLNSQINLLLSHIASDEARLDKLKRDYLVSLKKIRARKNSNSDIAFIFGSKDFNQAMRRMRFLREISRWRERKSKEIRVKMECLEREKNELAQSKAKKDQLLNIQLSAQAKLETKYRKQDAVVAGLRKNGSVLKSQLSKKQAEANALKIKIASLIAEENRKAEEAKRRQEEMAKKVSDSHSDKSYADARKRKPRSGSDTAGSNNTSVASTGAQTGFAAMKGSLRRPVDGLFRITNRFGRHALPELPDVVYDNPGIDAQTTSGTPAKAVYEGEVSGVYMLPGFSTVVIVNHGNYYTVYGNIDSPSVRVGTKVKQGQSLGVLAPDEENPGYSSIHFEVWKNREKLNPEQWLK